MIVWGLLFAVYDGAASRPAPWLKGIIFGVFTWLMMMVTFMPLAGAGFFGAKVDISTHIGLLVLNLIFGAVLGVTYDLLGVVAPVRLAASPARETVPVTEAERLRLSSPVMGKDHCVARTLELCRIVDLKRVKWIVGSEGKTSIRMARAHGVLQRASQIRVSHEREKTDLSCRDQK